MSKEDTKAMPVVALVGRPNVGKSTLFNRLLGERTAIVHDTPGVTRDRHYADTDRWGRDLMFIDTGGLEPSPDSDLFKSMRQQALIAVQEADVVLLVVDVRAGMTPMDEEVARLLRGTDTPVLLVCNKVEGFMQEDAALEFYALGMPELFTISAEHGTGVSQLMDEVLELLPPAPERDLEAEQAELETTDELRIAVVGRPNIGKSTLVNRMIGEDRHIVADMPGTTMDSVDSVWTDGERVWRFVDTAGVRRKSKVDAAFEGYAVSQAIRSIERCHVTLLMIDGAEGVTEQDARLARRVIDRGRCLVILVNKWDLVREDPDRNVRVVEDEMDRRLPHTQWAPVLYISALTGKGVHRILETIERIYEQFNKRLSTSETNRFLQLAVANHSVPQRHNRPVKLNYMTQVRVRPPTFVLFANTPEGVEESYKRYLVNRLRDAYGFEGTPIRIDIKRKRRPGEDYEEEV
ncbi:MAG: ribosome biogenesis GTPase Der [Myxococcota bacterium]|nr:ribosome biogenesis GTPase Der [Myxococcota bacterium]